MGLYIASPCERDMTQRWVTATNQLSIVVDALQLGEKTGILTVERGEGSTFEEGVIVLVRGQVVNAAIGPQRGRDAAARLSSWQACRFSFVSTLSGQADAGQGRGPIPAVSAETNVVSKYLRDSFDDVQQMSPAVQDYLSRRPYLAASSHEALGTILRALDRQGFSRAHRRVFLLIDGRRSLRELAALISRTPDETLSLLADLEQAGFIQL